MTATLRLLALLGPHARRLGVAATAALTAEAAAVALTATAGWLIARAAGRPELAALALAIVAVRGLALTRGFLRYAERLTGHDAVLRATASLRARVFDAVRPLAPAGTPAFRSGDLLARLVDDVDAAQDLVLRCVVPAVVALGVGAGAVALAAAVLPAAGLVLACGLVVSGLAVPAVTGLRARREEDAGSGRGPAAVRADLASRAVDLARGADDLRVLGAAEDHHRAAADRVAHLARLQRRAARATGLASAVVLTVHGLTATATALVALRAVAAGALDLVGAVVVTVLAIAAGEVVVPLGDAARRLPGLQAAARRLTALWDTPPPVAEPAEPVAPSPGTAVTLPQHPTLVVRGLVARHPGAARPAVDGVDLTVAPGERVAISGASGSGKSTLVAVLMRFLDPEAGQVLLGGHDLRSLPGDAVRRAMTGMTQDAHVFGAPVRDNLRLAAPDAGDEELLDVLHRVRLDGWLAALPAGLATELTPGGTTLSGGQRVRLLLARALLADPAVLLLDEPTDGLDDETARAVLRELLAAVGDRAVVLVTHDPVDPGLVDRSVVLTAGHAQRRSVVYTPVGTSW